MVPRRATGFDQQLAYDFAHLLFEVRVFQSAQRVEAVRGVADCNLAVDDACAHGAEHLAKFGLRPHRPESAGACADDCDWLVTDGVRLLRMVFVVIGRDTQSSAFLSTPGTDELYSGVTKKTPSVLAIAARRPSTVSGALIS